MFLNVSNRPTMTLFAGRHSEPSRACCLSDRFSREESLFDRVARLQRGERGVSGLFRKVAAFKTGTTPTPSETSSPPETMPPPHTHTLTQKSAQYSSSEILR